MVNKVLNKKNILILVAIIISPVMCITVNYIILTLMWLGRYLGTFFRLLFSLVS